MGIDYLQWEYSEHKMGIKNLQWEHCITHDGNRIFTMGTLHNPQWE